MKTSNIFRFFYSENAGNEPVGDDFFVLFEILPVLGLHAVLVPVDPVHQQYGHVDDVEVGEEVVAPAAHAVCERL